MALTRLNVLLIPAVFLLVIFNVDCAVLAVKGIHNNTLSSNTTAPKNAGVCTLEVPTIDLLTENDKVGVVPRGNGSRAGLSKIQICCSGWERIPHSSYRCKPVCDNGCVNGNCTAPNTCICLPGYIYDFGGNCVPTCASGHACLNGVCTVNNDCSCNAGFKLDVRGKMCEPVCTGGCGNGNCTAPQTCHCNAGFNLNPETNRCEYHCEGGCGSGECIGPNKCSCKPGYVMKDKTCEAMCPSGCKNGVCIAPNKCGCKEGWNLDPKTGTDCVPHCSDACLNAVCSAPDTCTCKNGYVKDLRASPAGNRCVAHCPAGCINGTCSAPNFCICNPGYVKEVKGSSKCVKRERRSPKIMFELIPDQF